ncbi:RNA-binding protein 34 [Phytophthora citrophthora]|uniref:RNA-binding protein 34 n=1 Tax=Phytophthora citrophthora TaxID=4793 RepID=A0AAD9LFT9_9STRA|nr:RNA-binding protein 34 [Phytophthora citrophthora]
MSFTVFIPITSTHFGWRDFTIKTRTGHSLITMDEQQKPEPALAVDPQADDTAQEEVSSTPVNGTSLGGRVRRTTQMFTFSKSKSDEPEEFSPPTGKGVKVREMEFVRNNIEALNKKQHDMIKQLYSIMYGRRFQQKNVKVIKEHILDFSGVIEQDEKSRENLIAKMGKWKLVFVHEVMDLLAVDRSKKSFDEEGKPHNKEALLDRLVDWLYNPEVTKLGEKKAAIVARKEKQKVNKRAKKVKAAEKSKAEPAKKKRKTTKKKAVTADEEDDDHEATESEGDESSSDFEEAKKPSKKRKAPRRAKKSAPVDEEDEEEQGKDEDAAEKDETQDVMVESASKDKEQSAAEPEEETNAADKDESTKPETEALDADVCSKVKDIIANGDAEELTVKKLPPSIYQSPSTMGKKSKSKSAPAANDEPKQPVLENEVVEAVKDQVKNQDKSALADGFAQSAAFFGKKASYAPVMVETTAKEETEAPKITSEKNRKKKEKKKAKKNKLKQKTETEDDNEEKEETEEDAEADDGEKKKKKKKKSKKNKTEDAEEEEEKELTPEDLKNRRTIFVGNVSLDATPKDIKKHFSVCGKVENVRLRNLPVAGCAVDQHGNQKLMMKVCAIKKILTTAKDNCNAYVTFAEESCVDAALKLNGTTLVLKKIRVTRSEPVLDARRSIFVGNVPFKCTDDSMMQFFTKRLRNEEEPEPVESVRLIRDRESDLGKGFGYLLLKSPALVAKTLALKNLKMETRELRVEVCGKRFKNMRGEETVKEKFEGLRASAGARARIHLKRKAGAENLEQSWSTKKMKRTAAAAGLGKKLKPKHAARKAAKAAAEAAAANAKGNGSKKRKHDHSASKKAEKPKAKKPKQKAKKE